MLKALRRFVVVTLLGLVALVSASSAAARAALTIKLATFAPANSAWHQALLDMGDAWAKSTEGRVMLRVYPGGTLGTESSTVKMMSLGGGELHAALLLPPGLARIDDAVGVFGMPFFLESDEEMRAVFQAMRPIMMARIERKGYKVLNWGHGGWVQLFSKNEIRTLADLQAATLHTTEGDDKAEHWYKANGFQPVPLSFNDMVRGLNRGMIEAAPAPAYGASMLQIFPEAPFLLDVKFAPLLGAMVMTNDAWNRIDAADQSKLLAEAARLEARFMNEAPALDAAAIGTMRQRGLKVTTLTPAANAEFRKTAEALVASMRGTMVPADVFDAAMNARNAYRRTRGRAALTIKLATFAPAKSAWHTALLDMGDAWAKSTEGRVMLRVYPDGSLGTEASTVEMMSPAERELQAALLLPPGLARIDDAVGVFGMPFFLESEEEMRAVFQAMRPIMTDRLERNGYKVLNWGHGGWVQLFSKNEIRTLADVKAARLHTSEGDDEAVQWYKAHGFKPVPLPLIDMVSGLKRAMINAAPTPAYGALMLQMFRDAPFMLDLKVAPLLGATVMTNDAWNQIDAADQSKVLAEAARLEARFMSEALELDAEAIDTMRRGGLKVTTLTPAAKAEFRKSAEALVTSMRDTLVPADVFDAAMNARSAYRKAMGGR